MDTQERIKGIFNDVQTKRIQELEKLAKLHDGVLSHLINDLADLRKDLDKVINSTPMNIIPDSGIFKVKTIFFNKEYVYMGNNFIRYIVELEGFANPFIMDRQTKKNITPVVGGNIFCKIDGDKLKDVEVIHIV